MLVDLPGAEYMALLENLFDLLKSTTNSFGVHEEDVDEGGEIEGSEDEIRLVGD